MSTTSNLIDQMVTAIAVAHSSINLTNRVYVGMMDQPETNGAWAWIHPTPLGLAEGASVREWAVQGGFEIRVYAPVGVNTAKARIYAALDAVSDIQRAIWTAMVGSPSSPAITVAAQTVSSEVFDGSVLGAQFGAWGIASIQVGYVLHTTEGRI